jgi:sulfur-carrier protein
MPSVPMRRATPNGGGPATCSSQPSSLRDRCVASATRRRLPKHATSTPDGVSGVKVVVLYFAALRELLGVHEEPLELPPSVSCVADLATFLGQRHPALVPHFSSVRFALNETFVDAAALLGDGDVVALIPPVTGG